MTTGQKIALFWAVFIALIVYIEVVVDPPHRGLSDHHGIVSEPLACGTVDDGTDNYACVY